MHAALLAQATHTPAVHTKPAPHVVPSSAATPVSMHVSAAPLQLRRLPLWHRSAGVHAAPVAHGTHAPALQTIASPQDWPAGALAKGMQIVPPPGEQPRSPIWQPPDVRHPTPVPGHVVPQETPSHVGVLPSGAGQRVQDVPHVATEVSLAQIPLQSCVPIGHAHEPAVQVSPELPHGVPSVAIVWRSMQVGIPVEQLVIPRWHGLSGVHATFAAHGMHAPPEQTRPSPHVVPSSARMPVSTHEGVSTAQL